MTSIQDFHKQLHEAFPQVKVNPNEIAHRSAYPDELKQMRKLSSKTWSDVTFDECIDTHDCLELLTPIAVVAYLPAFLLHTLDVAEADFLFEYVLSWLSRPHIEALGDQFALLTPEQRSAVCLWLHHIQGSVADDGSELELVERAKTKWECGNLNA